MREARLIVPEADNTGRDLPHVHQTVSNLLVSAFGGFTLTAGQGGWRSGAFGTVVEPVRVYDVAMANTVENVATLRDIADFVRNAMAQEAVYLRLPSGDVEFVTAPTSAKAA